MTTELMWPEWVLRPTGVTPLHLTAMTTSGGKSPSGSEQIVGNSPGRNRIVFDGVSVTTAEQERVWRSIAASLGGRSGVIMVPVMSRRTAPWPTVGGIAQRSRMKVALTDDILFSNGADLYAKVITAEADMLAVAGSIAFDIRMKTGSALKSGMVFQTGEYAYTLTRVLSATADGSDTVYSVKFLPPAREDIGADDELDFDNPRFRARLEDDQAMSLDLAQMRFGNTTLSFIEDT